MDVSSASTQNIYVDVTAQLGGVFYNPTSDTVQMAFVASGVTPATGDWQNATWQTVAGTNYAVCLIGPGAGGIALAKRTWAVWVQVQVNPEVSPEIPILFSGYLNITT